MKKKSASQSAFFKLRLLLGILLCFAGVTIVLVAQPRTPAARSASSQPIVHAQFRGVLPVVKFDISPPLRDMKPLPWKQCTLRENEDRDINLHPTAPLGPVVPDPVVQRVLGKIGIPAPIISFDGNSNLCGCSPPDPNGAVGPNNVVTMANLHFQIFDKSGNSLFGPAANNTLWSGFGGDCQTDNSGDPVVLYDQLADRWILTQFTSSGPTYFECVAVSQTNDPTGSFFRYAISTGNNFPDYPKAGMWPDAYYFSTREFQNGVTFVGAGAYALDRTQALAGDPNPTVVGFLAPPTPLYIVGDGLLPTDLDGQTLPPAGSPNFFVGSQDDNASYGAPSDALNLYKFHYDPVTPANSTFTLTNTLPTQPFNSIMSTTCTSSRACIPQPGTANKIDHLGYRQRPLFRLAYRNFGDHESLVTNQSVNAGTGPNSVPVSGVRWWELRDPNGSPVIFQEGTYAPGLTDGIHRWMGSIAMNSLGDIALGFSASNDTNPSVFPSVYYTARHAGDPPGQMTLGEGSIINGTGSQTGSARWGDYTAIDIDPTDDTTFWYINEYVPTTGSISWRLRIGAFNLAGGTPSPTPTGSPTATPTATATTTATATATATPTASVPPSPTATATAPRSTPTPRPRPTVPPRP
jgi:cell division septation protein DedD